MACIEKVVLCKCVQKKCSNDVARKHTTFVPFTVVFTFYWRGEIKDVIMTIRNHPQISTATTHLRCYGNYVIYVMIKRIRPIFLHAQKDLKCNGHPRNERLSLSSQPGWARNNISLGAVSWN